MCAFTRSVFLSLFFVIAFFTYHSPLFASQFAKGVRDIEGTLEIRAASFLKKGVNQNPSEIIQYALRVNKDQVYYLVFSGNEPSHLKTGQRIKVKQGLLKWDQGSEKKILVSPNDFIVTKDVNQNEIPTAFGPQKTLTILVNFQDQPTNQPWTSSQIKDTIYNVGSSMVNEFSYQQATIVGDVAGWFTLAIPSSATCDVITNSLPSLALSAATASGVNTAAYNHFIYMFPNVASCNWAGLGSIGGTPSNAWINGLNRSDSIVHEFGHNLGLYHSHSLECPNSSNQGTCTSVEYGDLGDTMGYTYTYLGPHYNAFQKERLGWLSFTTSPPIQTVTTTGTYTIYPYENATKNVKALKILKTANASSNDYYYLELRQGNGFDKYMGMCTDCDFTKGVLVHQANSASPNSSYMLDMSPLDNNKSKLVTLLPGASFTDATAANGGVTFSVNAVSTTSATVNVVFGTTPPVTCTRSTPMIQISPGYGIVKQGQTARFDVRVISTDTASCPAANFTFSATKISDQIPVSWTPASANIAPGSSQTFTVTAFTSATTPTGYYDVRVNAVNSADPSAPVFTIGTLQVNSN